MTDKQPCRDCGKPILPTTAARNDGRCMPCKGGYRENIEAGKRYADEQRKYRASAQALYWTALVHQVHGSEQGFAELTLAEQHYYAVSVLVGEVYNGGFDQYFGNSSAQHYTSACAGLAELGAVQTLGLLQEAKRLLFGAQAVPVDQGERQMLMPTYADERDLACEAALDALDRLFYADNEQLDQRLLKHARTHQLFEMEADEQPPEAVDQ